MKKYYFEDIVSCEMCGDSSKKHKVLGQRINTSQGMQPKKKTGVSVTVLKNVRIAN